MLEPYGQEAANGNAVRAASQSGARNGAGPGNANGASGTSARVPLEQIPGYAPVGAGRLESIMAGWKRGC
jgi:hypothetical protein